MKKLLPNSPQWLKLWVAKILIRMLKDLSNDIILYNELSLWIETKGKPQTSNINHWLN